MSRVREIAREETLLAGDCLDGASDEPWELTRPTVEHVRHAVGRLDQARWTLVSLVRSPGHPNLTIGGGAGHYVVYLAPREDVFFNLLSESQPDGPVVLVTAGGQPGDYPARQVVSQRQAVAAAVHFLAHGDMDPGQAWERQ